MRRGNHPALRLAVFVFVLSVLMPACVSFAADYGVDSAVEYVQNFTRAGSGMMETLLRYARSLFIALATLSLALGLIRMLLNGEANLGTVAAHVARWILYTGVFSWLMSNDVPQTIVNSFVEMGDDLGGASSIAPDNILSAGIRMYGTMVQRSWEAGWGDFIGVTLLGVVILVTVAMIAGTFALALIEMHLVICGGAVLLGFGGFEYTRDIALSYIKYVISVGIKLLMIMILYGLANNFIPSWEDSFSKATDLSTLITAAGQILGGVICIYMVVRHVPNMAQAVVNRASLSFGHPSPSVVYTSLSGNAPAVLQSNGGFVSALMDALRGRHEGGGLGGSAGDTAPAPTVPPSGDYAVREFVRGQDGMLSGAGYNPITARQAAPLVQNPANAEAMTNYIAAEGAFGTPTGQRASAGLASAGSAGAGLASAGLAGAGPVGAGLAEAGLANAGLAGAGFSGSGSSDPTGQRPGAGLAGAGFSGSGSNGLTGQRPGAGLASTGLAGAGFSGSGLSGPTGQRPGAGLGQGPSSASPSVSGTAPRPTAR